MNQRIRLHWLKAHVGWVDDFWCLMLLAMGLKIIEVMLLLLQR